MKAPRRSYKRPDCQLVIPDSPEPESHDSLEVATPSSVIQDPGAAQGRNGSVKLTETDDTMTLEIRKEIKMSGETIIDGFRLQLRNTALDSARSINSLAKAEDEMIVAMQAKRGKLTDDDQPGAKRQRTS